jgi:APA family basic amino acid/polyamine antiporter
MTDPNNAPAPTLRRALSLPMMVLYGLGTTIGAGIYALIGEVAGVAGYGAPLSFLIASLVAGLTACSFAEMAGRYPRAAGAALYVQEGFGSRDLARLVGLLVVLTGVVSAAAMVNAFSGYLQVFLPLDRAWAIVAIVPTLGVVAGWGIAESVTAAALITIVEVGGLLLVIAVGADAFVTLPERLADFLPGSAATPWVGILFGVILAFYAFIGFEDMVDVAEEVQDARANLPRAILLTLGITTAVYVLLMFSALLTLTPAALDASGAPLASLYEAHTGREPVLIGLIAVFAILNGALIQVIMGARVLYGLASRNQLPKLFARVNARTRTPLVATALIVACVLVFALWGRLEGLATATSMLMLTIFALVNLSLWRIKGHESEPPETLTFPRTVPMLGFLLTVAFLARGLFGS